jgi:uncharacterized membrane protein YheB (UPF0754 family)
MLLQALLNSILGGATGYVTNNIAIKMLFKKYFGFGGVIEKTRDEFIENISKLIEKDLINHNTILPEIEKEEFREALFEVIKDTISLYLPQNSGKIKIKEIEGFEESKNNLINFFEKTKLSIILQIKNLYLNKPLNSVISDEQFDFIALKITDYLYGQKNIYKDSILNLIYEYLNNKKVDEVLSFKVINRIEENIKEIIEKTDFHRFDGDIENYVYEVLEIINIDTILKKVENDINSMQLKNLINNRDNLSKEVLNRIIEVVNNNLEIIEKFSENLIKSLKNINLTLYDILDKNSIDKIERFLENKFPIILSKIIYLIEQNKEEIENIINKTIKEHFSNKGKIGELIVSFVDVFVSNISDRLGIISKIIKKVEDFRDEAPHIITQEILLFLRENSVSEIIEKLEDEQILNSKIVTNLIINNIQTIRLQNNINFLDEFFDKKIGNIYKIELSFIKTEIIPAILEKIKSENIIKKEINKNLDNFIKEIKKQDINQFLTKIKWDISHSDIENFIDSKKGILNKNLGEFIKIDNNFEYEKYLNLLSETKLDSIYKALMNNEIYNELTKASIKVLKLNLDNILKNNVSLAVSRELNKYSSIEIRNMVENFMGKELQPINYLGAGLGIVAGGGYYVVTAPLANPYLNYATPLIYGITGVVTNKIAIKMLFKPYEEKRIFGIKVPFTPGVVAKNKPKFAKNISNFVKNGILSDKSLKVIFENSKSQIESLLFKKISQNNYQAFDRILKEDDILDKLSHKSFEAGIALIEKNSEIITEKIFEIISSIDLKEYKEPIKDRIKQEIRAIDYGEKIQFIIDEFIYDNENLLEYKEYLFLAVDNFIQNLIDKFIELLNLENLTTFILKYEKEYNEFIQKSLNSILNENIQKNISAQISKKIISLASNDELIDSLIENSLSKDKKLNEIFGGKLVYLLEKNLDYMIENMLNMVTSQRDNIISSIELPALAKWVISDSDIEAIVDKLIYNKFPVFIDSKKSKIKTILEEVLEYKVGQIGIEVDKNEIKEMFIKVTNSTSFNHSIESISNSFVLSIMTLKLKEVLEILNIKNLKQLIELFNLVLDSFIKLSKTQILQTKNSLIEVSKRDIKKILADILRENSLKNIFKEVSFKSDINYLSDEILNNKKFQKLLDDILDEILNNLLTHNIYNQELLKKDILNFIKTYLKEDKEKLREIFEPYFRELFLELNDILDVKTKDEVVAKIIDALINSIENNLNIIIKSINLQQIIEKEINNMSPKEIEELFYSFAGKYFNKLELYGIGGAVFGIPSMFIN